MNRQPPNERLSKLILSNEECQSDSLLKNVKYPNYITFQSTVNCIQYLRQQLNIVIGEMPLMDELKKTILNYLMTQGVGHESASKMVSVFSSGLLLLVMDFNSRKRHAVNAKLTEKQKIKLSKPKANKENYKKPKSEITKEKMRVSRNINKDEKAKKISDGMKIFWEKRHAL